MSDHPWYLLPPEGPEPAPAPVPPVDRHEVARFTREQPPPTIPPRTRDRPVPGLVAGEVLGWRVIRPLMRL